MDYIAHHGILGQKWGVRRYQNPDGSLTPAGHKRYLNRLDKKARGHVIAASNLKYINKKYSKKSLIANDQGEKEKSKNFKRIAKDAENAFNKEVKEYSKTQKEISDGLKDLEKSGYHWKTIPLEFAQTAELSENGRKFIKDHPIATSLDYSVNASSGNYYKVKGKLSDKRAKVWARNHEINSHRPQKVVTRTVYV